MQNQLALGSFKQPGELSSWLRMLVPSWNKFLHTYLLPNIFLENKISRKQEEDAKWVHLPASCSLILDVLRRGQYSLNFSLHTSKQKVVQISFFSTVTIIA